MKTLAITLCTLLVILPAGAQQVAGVRTPNFYVAYGARDVPVGAVSMESSSDVMRIAEPPQRGGVRPMPRPYPIRRRGYRRYGPGYGGYPPPLPEMSTTGAVIAGLVAVGLAIAVVARGDN